MVCSGAQVSGTQELSKGMPQVRFKLPASVSGDGGRRAKKGDPSGDECSHHCLCSDVCDGYCLRLPCELVPEPERIDVVLYVK